MSITIDGNQIPERLFDVVRNNKWRTPAKKELWKNLVPSEHIIQPSLYPLEKADGRSLWASEAGDDFVGVADANVRPGTLDPRRAIIIGDLGPERLLALDLRTSESNPSVCAFLPREDDESCWVEIASGLDDFLIKLGIVRPQSL